MALFPTAKFEVLLPGGIVTPGRRLEAELVVRNDETIPRAEHVSLVFNSTAWAGYGSGKSRSVVTRTIFLAPLNSDLPAGELPPGVHRYPFLIEIPDWLPPAYSGSDCGIVHRLEARLDVDWAIDPTASLVPTVAMPPRTAVRTPRSTRSPAGFHDSIVLEVLLESTTVTQDEPLRGQVALRSGHDARFDAVDLCLASVAHVPMGRGDRRRGGGQTIHVPASSLRSGEPVPFVFPPTSYAFPPSFQDGFLDHQVGLFVSVDIPWAIDPSFEIAIEMLPHGSTVVGGPAEGAVGSERLRRVSMAMAQTAGLRQGLPPTLVEGAHGPVSLRLVDSARGGNIGVMVEMTYPDVELGIRFRPLGVLEGFRESPLLPPGLRDQYLLRCEPEGGRAALADADLEAFFGPVVGELGKPDEVRLSDHHFALHYTLPNDEVERMTEIARFARDILNQMAEIIAEHFSWPTLKAMTNVQLLTKDEKDLIQGQIALAQQAAQQQAQMAAQQQAMSPSPGMPPAMPSPMGQQSAPPGASMAGQAPPASPPQIPPDIQEKLSKPTWEEIEQFLRQDNIRRFRIDVETDSTIEADVGQAKQDMTEFLSTIGQVLNQSVQMVAVAPPLAKLLGAVIKQGSRLFSFGRELEDIIDTTMDQIAGMPPQQQGQEGAKGEDPQVTQMKAMIEQMKLQQKEESEKRDAQLKLLEIQTKAEIEQMKIQAEAQRTAAEQRMQEQQMLTDRVNAAEDRQMEANDRERDRQFQGYQSDRDRAFQSDESQRGREFDGEQNEAERKARQRERADT